MKILIVQHKNFLNVGGGTEKICCFLANTFAKENHQVIIATNENTSGAPVFPLATSVTVENIYADTIIEKEVQPYFNYRGKNPLLWLYYKVKKKRAKFKNALLYRAMGGEENVFIHNLELRSKHWNTYINGLQPDVIVTMSTASLLEVSYCRTFDIPIINSVNGRPDYDYTDLLWERPAYEMKHLEQSYKHLSGIQVLFDSYHKFLPTTFRGQIQTIPNPVPQGNSKALKSVNEKNVITHIGTLNTSCKQQHKIVEAFSKLVKDFPNWEVHCYGTGADLASLVALTKQHNLTSQVYFKGFTDQPLKVLQEADIFVFPSKYEGFPLALTEAMASGLPTIGYSYCSGVNELINNGVSGYLVEDDLEFSERLSELMADEEQRGIMGQQAKEEMSRFNPNLIEKMWVNFVEELASKEYNYK